MYKYAAIASSTTVPDKYLLDRNYHLVKADVDNKIKFVGPKGVGKSSALLTIWSEALISGKSCILIGMETLSGYNTTEVSQYFSTLFDCAAVHSPRSLMNCVIVYYLLILHICGVRKRMLKS